MSNTAKADQTERAETPSLARRDWVPDKAETFVQLIAARTASAERSHLTAQIDDLIQQNRTIHEVDCINLNPATNVMNPRAEAALGSGLGSRPSLGYPGDKYEMGLEAIEQIEVIAAELAAEVFQASFAEIRVPSGALANMYAFMACSKPGDTIIAPSGAIGGHVTHHDAGVAGLYGITTLAAPVDVDHYTVDIVKLAAMVKEHRPAMITIGGSLNLHHHPVAEIRAIADTVGAKVLFDAAHLSGLIAGGAWPNPLAEGAHVMTMSTYKSLAGPPSGLLVSNDPAIAERVDAIAYPGLTANFDAAKSAALAITLLDWKACGAEYAAEMVLTASALAEALVAEGIPVYGHDSGSTHRSDSTHGSDSTHRPTLSHAFAINADQIAASSPDPQPPVTGLGAGQDLAVKLRSAMLLSSGIGLPPSPANKPTNGPMGGLRVGTNELVRWGMTASDMPELAGLVARAIMTTSQAEAQQVAGDVQSLRQKFRSLHFLA